MNTLSIDEACQETFIAKIKDVIKQKAQTINKPEICTEEALMTLEIVSIKKWGAQYVVKIYNTTRRCWHFFSVILNSVGGTLSIHRPIRKTPILRN